MRLAVVVPCRDRAALLADCLEALSGADEVLVVDAASHSGDVARVARAAGARLLRSPAGSASAARNLGWHSTDADAVAFTDDDCRPAPDWCARVRDALVDLDAVTGRVVAAGAGHLSVLDAAEPVDHAPDVHPALLGHGANLAVHRSGLELVGGWDERLGPGTRWPGAEDKDLLVRLLHRGCRVGYRPAPVVEHLQWRTPRGALRAEHGYARGAAALAAKGLGPGLTSLLRDSVTVGVRDARAGYRYGTVAGVVRTAGLVRGGLTARSLR